MRRISWIIALTTVAFAGLLAWSTVGQRRYRVEVCMEFQGRTECRAASGATRESALRTATENACALLAPGRTESRLCENQAPARTTWR
jgi:hypothetical protein